MHSIAELLDIMSRLRDPAQGCPWDRQQTYASLVPYTLEEAYEVAEAIEQGEFPELRDELGDLLFQVVFYAQIAREEGRFDFNDVVDAIAEKLIRRHPHVFGDQQVADAEEQSHAWERHKQQERAVKARVRAREPGVLDGVGTALPALVRAQKLQRRAARVGFDWPDIRQVADKVEEELQECRAEIERGADMGPLHEEIGDLLFSGVNLARHAGLDAESALRDANAKFERRFREVERLLRQRGIDVEDAGLEEMDSLWEQVKAAEVKDPDGVGRG